jgi:phosphoenolpyruvate synthase/pyruvate phosphate dikinase
VFVFDFDRRHARHPMELKDILGGKGANLAEMSSVLGLPVPRGFTITTDACRAFLDGLARRARRRARRPAPRLGGTRRAAPG